MMCGRPQRVPPLVLWLLAIVVIFFATSATAVAPPFVRGRAAPHSIERAPASEPRGSRKSAEGIGEASRLPDTNDGILSPGTAGSHSIFDGLSPNQKAALVETIAHNPNLRRLNIKNWRLRRPPTRYEIQYILKYVERPLPGRLELGLFVDPILFSGARQGITKTWRGRTPLEVPSTKVELEALLSSSRGNTLLLLGHVEGRSFVMRDYANQAIGAISIHELISKAQENNVVVIPIGCKSADAGSPIGTIGNISTDQVQLFLQDIQSPRPTVGDLFAAFEKHFGELHLDVSAVRSLFQVTVLEPASKTPTTHIVFSAPNNPGSRRAAVSESESHVDDVLSNFFSRLVQFNDRHRWISGEREKSKGDIVFLIPFTLGFAFWLSAPFIRSMAASRSLFEKRSRFTIVALIIYVSVCLNIGGIAMMAFGALWGSGTVGPLVAIVYLVFVLCAAPLLISGDFRLFNHIVERLTSSKRATNAASTPDRIA